MSKTPNWSETLSWRVRAVDVSGHDIWQGVVAAKDESAARRMAAHSLRNSAKLKDKEL
jgi:hypothetical protein